jgi:hypothetical protein
MQHKYRKRWLDRLPKRAITERKLEDEATQLAGKEIPLTGFDAAQVFADMLDISLMYNSYTEPDWPHRSAVRPAG